MQPGDDVVLRVCWMNIVKILWHYGAEISTVDGLTEDTLIGIYFFDFWPRLFPQSNPSLPFAPPTPLYIRSGYFLGQKSKKFSLITCDKSVVVIQIFQVDNLRKVYQGWKVKYFSISLNLLFYFKKIKGRRE